MLWVYKEYNRNLRSKKKREPRLDNWSSASQCIGGEAFSMTKPSENARICALRDSQRIILVHDRMRDSSW